MECFKKGHTSGYGQETGYGALRRASVHNKRCILTTIRNTIMLTNRSKPSTALKGPQPNKEGVIDSWVAERSN